MRETKAGRGLFRQRRCWVPTWRGWLALLLLAAAGVVLAAREIHPFLAVNVPVRGGALVVEGWVPDHALKAVVDEFRRGSYTAVFVVGGPLDRGAPLSDYQTYAELGAATLTRLGVATNSLRAVPAPRVQQDRTFASARALKRWLTERGGAPRKLTVVSVGPHARRTRLLFARAFGKGVELGIIAVPSPEYDAQRWWTSSYGVRVVISETVAYLYTKLVFRPEAGQ